MCKELKCYINGEWVEAGGSEIFNVINPATEECIAKLKLGGQIDVDKAVEAAKEAFKTYSLTSRDERLNILQNILNNLEKRQDDLIIALTTEMGAPTWLAKLAQAPLAVEQTKAAIEALRSFEFEKSHKLSLIKKVPIGVCGAITPWNWPAGVIMAKIAPILATGCTVVMKPSVHSPLSAQVIAEIMDESGVPKGVFNMVHGSGEVVGKMLSSHPDIACISFTGSYNGGVDVSINAAPTVKRVVQELGGKSPNIILPSPDIRQKVKDGVKSLMVNSGQSCSAPSRMLVPKADYGIVKEAILEVESEIQPGHPDSGAFIGPVANKDQYERVQKYIHTGINEDATLLIGGPGKPEGLEKGYYIKPTVFINTTPDMKIVQEEIFGPVLVIQGYDILQEAVELANNTNYGLVAYVQGDDFEEVKKIADKIEAGQIYLNDSVEHLSDYSVPFGGFKQSGNGREGGEFGFNEFLEYKTIIGYYPENKS